MNKYICIHGHFYQPPRDNPWLESIEWQDSAYPYHDWNERVCAECYSPNAHSRILDDKGNTIDIVNNYEKISFNFGPTLLAWIKNKKPKLFRAIQQADQTSTQEFSGHGNGIAQAYNHMILPLANDRDKYTQIYWGIKSFENSFSRQAEGMWLPETAVDFRSLEIMASLNIKFTILSPHQAQKVRQINDGEWEDVSGAKINPKKPYLQKLPSGNAINIFFYDGPTSQSLAFDNSLFLSNNLQNKLLSLFENKHEAELVNIATDGETFGHHHPFGDMGLAYLLYEIDQNAEVQIINYSAFLALHPPTHEVDVIDNSSWSCIHGVERWKSNCGCNAGNHAGWHQNWRAPLRQAFDWLRDTIATLYEEQTKALLKDPWAARNNYIEIIENQSDEIITNYLKRYAIHDNHDNLSVVLKWLEVQHYCLLMYTSCGWFFEELSGLETIQVMKYAARAIQLTQSLCNIDLESEFISRLEQAPSNISSFENGKVIFNRFVKPGYLYEGL